MAQGHKTFIIKKKEPDSTFFRSADTHLMVFCISHITKDVDIKLFKTFYTSSERNSVEPTIRTSSNKGLFMQAARISPASHPC